MAPTAWEIRRPTAMSDDHDDHDERDPKDEAPEPLSARQAANGRNAQLSTGSTTPPRKARSPRCPVPAPSAEAMLLAVDELRTADSGSRRWWLVSWTEPGLLTDNDWLDLASVAAITNPEIARAMAKLERTRSHRKLMRLLRRIRPDVEETLEATYGSIAQAAEEVSRWYDLEARLAAAALSAA